MTMKSRGFTLVELIVVMVVTGILAAGLVVFFRPALDNYAMISRRAALTDLADGAMRAMMRDVRSAVPNSIRQPNNQCFEVVPTSDGGRLRTAADVNDASKPWLSTTGPSTGFEMIGRANDKNIPAVGDFVVVGNTTPDEIYGGSSRAAIKTASNTILTFDAKSFPVYEGGRFVIVPNAQQAVFYSCANATGVDANGTGKGTLYRFSSYGFETNLANNCKAPAAATAVVATRVESCEFTYDPNPGGAQAAGYMRMRIRLADQGDRVELLYGAYADNLP